MARSSSSAIESGPGVVAAKPKSPVRLDIRSDLLLAAHQLLREHDVQALTQQRVAASAGVRQSHLTYYFPTRNDLLRAVVQDVMVVLLESAPPEPADRPVSLARFRKVMLDRFTDRAGSRLMLALAVASEEDAALKPWLNKFDTDIRRRVHRLFENVGVHPAPDDLLLFHASLVGATTLDLSTATHASARQARKIIGLAFDCLVANGLAKPVESTLPRGSARSGRSWP